MELLAFPRGESDADDKVLSAELETREGSLTARGCG